MHNQKKTLPSQIKSNPLYHLEFDVKGANNETRNLTSSYDGMFIAKKIGQREGHQSINGLYSLAKPYNMPG